MRNRLIFILLATLLASCSSPESTARKELNRRQFNFNTTDFLYAAGLGDPQVLALFGKAGIDVNATNEVGRTALMEAAGKGKLPCVKLLLGAGADPRMVDAKGRDALIAAASGGHTEIARILLSRGAEATVKDAEGWSALTVAAFKGKAETVRLLAGQSPRGKLDEALLLGALNGDRDTVANLISQGAYVDARSPENLTPLMISAMKGHYEVASLLLNNKSDHQSLAPNGKDSSSDC